MIERITDRVTRCVDCAKCPKRQDCSSDILECLEFLEEALARYENHAEKLERGCMYCLDKSTRFGMDINDGSGFQRLEAGFCPVCGRQLKEV